MSRLIKHPGRTLNQTGGSHYGVVLMYSDIIERDFETPSPYHVNFRTNIHEKSMNSFLPHPAAMS